MSKDKNSAHATSPSLLPNCQRRAFVLEGSEGALWTVPRPWVGNPVSKAQLLCLESKGRNSACLLGCVCMWVRACACVRACVCACVRACVCVCVCVCVTGMKSQGSILHGTRLIRRQVSLSCPVLFIKTLVTLGFSNFWRDRMINKALAALACLSECFCKQICKVRAVNSGSKGLRPHYHTELPATALIKWSNVTSEHQGGGRDAAPQLAPCFTFIFQFVL